MPLRSNRLDWSKQFHETGFALTLESSFTGWEQSKLPPFFRSCAQLTHFVLVLSAPLAWYPCPFGASGLLALNDSSVTRGICGQQSYLLGSFLLYFVDCSRCRLSQVPLGNRPRLHPPNHYFRSRRSYWRDGSPHSLLLLGGWAGCFPEPSSLGLNPGGAAREEVAGDSGVHSPLQEKLSERTLHGIQ